MPPPGQPDGNLWTTSCGLGTVGGHGGPTEASGENAKPRGLGRTPLFLAESSFCFLLTTELIGVPEAAPSAFQ